MHKMSCRRALVLAAVILSCDIGAAGATAVRRTSGFLGKIQEAAKGGTTNGGATAEKHSVATAAGPNVSIAVNINTSSGRSGTDAYDWLIKNGRNEAAYLQPAPPEVMQALQSDHVLPRGDSPSAASVRVLEMSANATLVRLQVRPARGAVQLRWSDFDREFAHKGPIGGTIGYNWFGYRGTDRKWHGSGPPNAMISCDGGELAFEVVGWKNSGEGNPVLLVLHSMPKTKTATSLQLPETPEEAPLALASAVLFVDPVVTAAGSTSSAA